MNPPAPRRIAAPCGILPALDLDTPEAILRLVEATTGIEGVVGYKLGLTMTLGLGLDAAVAALREFTDLPVYYDHQKAGPDVGDMAEKFSEAVARAGADGVILFPLAGPRAVDGFVGGALGRGLTALVGGDLPLADYNVSGGGYVADDALERIFARAHGCGADHFIVPGRDPAKVRHHAEQLRALQPQPRLFIPGIGALGGSIADTFAAAQGCRRYAIVGRAIYADPDPAEAARRLAGDALALA